MININWKLGYSIVQWKESVAGGVKSASNKGPQNKIGRIEQDIQKYKN